MRSYVTLLVWGLLIIVPISSTLGAPFKSDYPLKSILNDKTIHLNLAKHSSYQVLLFLSSRCPCSRSYSQYLNNLQASYPNYTFLGIVANQDEDLEVAKSYFQTLELKFPIVFDEKALVADELNAIKTPHAFIIAPGGNVVYNGGIADRRDLENAKVFYLKQVLEDISAHRAPRYQHTRALGCYISRK